MKLTQRGVLGEVVYAHLDPGADLLPALWELCADEGVKTGVILDITGSLDVLTVHTFDQKGTVITQEIPGPLAVTATGIIGEGWLPAGPPAFAGPTAMASLGFLAHQSPYVHVHVVARREAGSTVVGHLLPGSFIADGTADSGSSKEGPAAQFTVLIATGEGVRLRAVVEPTCQYHDLSSGSANQETPAKPVIERREWQP